MKAIVVKKISKSFKIYIDASFSLKERVLFRKRNSFEHRQVLNNISFSVTSGTAIGIIGENGCGKSTLLKLLTKIIYPDSGNIEIKGRVSSLIELGAGFHPDMSGMENIYTNASIFGLTRKEIEKRIDKIVDFSELGEKIMQPVRTYSSGMYMRLAFSVAINVNADVLLIDEILAVGDANFQAKCFNKLREIKANGTTIVLVSHSLGQIEQICDETFWIDNGIIREIGIPEVIHSKYLEHMGKKMRLTTSEVKDLNFEKNEKSSHLIGQSCDLRPGDGSVRFVSINILNEDVKEITSIQTGQNINVEMSYETKTILRKPILRLAIYRNDGVLVYGTSTHRDHLEFPKLDKEGKVTFHIKNIPLLPAEYRIDIAISSLDGIDYDVWRDSVRFTTYTEFSDVGVSRVEHRWEIN